jgi:hypothetical protein
VLPPRLPGRIVDVVALMRAIEDSLPRGDGVAAFTSLYLAVTEAVGEAVESRRWGDERCLRWLDVVFANHYFRALREHVRGSAVPRAWAPLIDARSRRGIAQLQFALAGMNAHINRDLPLALVETWQALGIEPRRGSPQHRDFRRVNDLLAATEDRVKARFAAGPLGYADRQLGALDDVVAMWNVRKARDAAWINAETLWTIRDVSYLRREFVAMLDRMVGFAGRGLLRPVLG